MQVTSAPPHTPCPLDPSPTSEPTFEHAPMVLLPSYIVAPKTAHSTLGEATSAHSGTVTSRNGQAPVLTYM